MSLSPVKALSYLDKNYGRFQEELFELLRIPSISNNPAHQGDMKKAADWIAGRLSTIGMSNVEVIPTSGHPVVYGESLIGGLLAPTVLIYGHYDVQSPEPLDDWKSLPFEPIIKGDNIYARGASDMKGQLIATISAVEAIFQNKELPLNIKFIIEGEEEIGSEHFKEVLTNYREKLACNFSLNTDSGEMPDPNTPTICYALRGGAIFELRVFGPSKDVHSGQFGGVIENPIHVLSELIANLHDNRGHITLPDFYNRVRPIDANERAELAQLPFDEAYIRHSAEVSALWGEPEYTPFERISARPSVDVIKFEAGHNKPAIPAKAIATIMFRLVPDQDVQEISQQFHRYLEINAPSTVHWELKLIVGHPGTITSRNSAEVIAMKKALNKVFGKQPIFLRAGGSIPAVLMFQQILGIESVLTGFALDDDNFHGPNEKINLPTWKKGMAAIVYFFYNLMDVQ